jgi:hypothetical protein
MLSIDFCCGRCRIRAPRGRPTVLGDPHFPHSERFKIANEFDQCPSRAIHKYYYHLEMSPTAMIMVTALKVPVSLVGVE